MIDGVVGKIDTFRTKHPNDRVRESTSKLLLNKCATRNNILRAFESLCVNDAIQRDDPIIIYYAGHGTLGVTPLQWKDDGWVEDEVQFIVPFDCGKDVRDAIPDRTIATCLNDLASQKGNNIVRLLHLLSLSSIFLKLD